MTSTSLKFRPVILARSRDNHFRLESGDWHITTAGPDEGRSYLSSCLVMEGRRQEEDAAFLPASGTRIVTYMKVVEFAKYQGSPKVDGEVPAIGIKAGMPMALPS